MTISRSSVIAACVFIFIGIQLKMELNMQWKTKRAFNLPYLAVLASKYISVCHIAPHANPNIFYISIAFVDHSSYDFFHWGRTHKCSIVLNNANKWSFDFAIKSMLQRETISMPFFKLDDTSRARR